MYKHTIYIYVLTQIPLMAETVVIPAAGLDALKQKQVCYFWSDHLKLCTKNASYRA